MARSLAQQTFQINSLDFKFNNSLENIGQFQPCRFNCLLRNNQNSQSFLNSFLLQSSQSEKLIQQQQQPYWQQNQERQIFPLRFNQFLTEFSLPINCLPPQLESHQQPLQSPFISNNYLPPAHQQVNNTTSHPFQMNSLLLNQLQGQAQSLTTFEKAINSQVSFNKQIHEQNQLFTGQILHQSELPEFQIEVRNTFQPDVSHIKDQTSKIQPNQDDSFIEDVEQISSKLPPLPLMHKIIRKKECIHNNNHLLIKSMQLKQKHQKIANPVKKQKNSISDKKDQKTHNYIETNSNNNNNNNNNNHNNNNLSFIIPASQLNKKSLGWCMQSEQLLFEWNNTVLKQISVRSDKIVNESVNVSSYVNILSKSRIMLISQDTRSLKYQINLIDLSREQVICKHQLGSNFQMHPFEPDKLRVQTVKINERVSCIYLRGGQYFKLIDNRTLKNIKRIKQLCIQQVLPLYRGNQVVVLSLNGIICVYSTVNDKYNLIREIKIKKNPQQIGISYVSNIEVDTAQQLLYCCVVSSKSQQIQIFHLITGQLVQIQEIGILNLHNGYEISNMKLFRNHLYIELQLKVHLIDSNRRMFGGNNNNHSSAQYKVQSYKIDQQFHLIESKLYDNSNILNTSFSSQQFFLYDSRKSCIIGFEKRQPLNSIEHSHNSEHYLTHDPCIFRHLKNDKSSLIQEPNNSGLSLLDNRSLKDTRNISSSTLLPRHSKQQNGNNSSNSLSVAPDQQRFKLNVKLTSPNHCPIFTHIFKEIPHDLVSNRSQSSHISIKQTSDLNFNSITSSQGNSQLQMESELHEMVLTLFDQNKNVYKIYQN